MDCTLPCWCLEDLLLIWHRNIRLGQNNECYESLIHSHIACNILFIFRLIKWILLFTMCVPLSSLFFFLVPPKIYDISPNITVNEGGNISLFCFASGKPEPKITWRHITPSGKLIFFCNMLTIMCTTTRYIEQVILKLLPFWNVQIWSAQCMCEQKWGAKWTVAVIRYDNNSLF